MFPHASVLLFTALTLWALSIALASKIAAAPRGGESLEVRSFCRVVEQGITNAIAYAGWGMTILLVALRSRGDAALVLPWVPIGILLLYWMLRDARELDARFRSRLRGASFRWIILGGLLAIAAGQFLGDPPSPSPGLFAISILGAGGLIGFHADAIQDVATDVVLDPYESCEPLVSGGRRDALSWLLTMALTSGLAGSGLVATIVSRGIVSDEAAGPAPGSPGDVLDSGTSP